jgi:hypothetical protein
MTEFICATCGTQYPASANPPEHCPICEDERQYVGLGGQQWTTLEELRDGRRNLFEELEPGLTAIRSEPGFAINQRALVVQSPGGNLLWDCIALIDGETVDRISAAGGLRAIAISHPHYYTTMARWSDAFGDVAVWLHAADREHVMRPDRRLRFWDGDRHSLHDGMTLIRCGGHFAGGSVLHWPGGADGRGSLLSGDIIQVVPDRRWVSFMWSYPNLIPLPTRQVRGIVDAVEPFDFDRIYGAFHPMQVMSDGKGVVRRSAERYVRAISG